MKRRVRVIIGRNPWDRGRAAENREGWFHKFGTDTISETNGDLHTYQVAVVELDGGEVVIVYPENITFVD